MALKNKKWLIVMTFIMGVMTWLMKDIDLFMSIILGIATVVMVMMIIAVSLEPNE
jgi:hypothetical protein